MALDPLSLAVGAAGYATIDYIVVPVGRQISDALYTNPPEQS